MMPLNFGYFRDRTEKDLFFGKVEHFSDKEIFDLTLYYLQDVVKFLFGDIPNNERIILPVKNLSNINKIFSREDLKYHFAGKYFVFESQNNDFIKEFVDYFKNLYDCRIPLSHLHYSNPSIEDSTDSFRFTKNTANFHDMLPFPKYVIWAFENSKRLNVSEAIIKEWLKRDIKRLSEIKILDVKDDIFSFDIILESRPLSETDWL